VVLKKTDASRRNFLKMTGLATAIAGATFYGPWKHNRVDAYATDKPILIGMTSDASGQYAKSGVSPSGFITGEIIDINGGLLFD
jgi:branched-chain amino acid transport system substrate-binding protein